MSDKHFRARITARAEFAHDLWMIRIDPGAAFPFQPGQYATLGVEGFDVEGRRLERPYSIVSSPHEHEVEFFFELVPHGATTPPLHLLHIGDEVMMRKVPKGRFTMDTSNPERNHHLLLCTVTGIAPFVSYVRTLFKDWKDGKFKGDHKLFVLNGASRSWEFGYRSELATFAQEVPWLTYIPTVSRPWEDADWKGEVGRVDELIRKYTDQWGCTAQNSTAYLCGHPDMVENGKGILKRVGFQKEHLKEEIYWIPEKAVT